MSEERLERALPPLRPSSRAGPVLTVVGQFLGVLTGRNAHDFDGIADHISGAFLGFRFGGQYGSLYMRYRRCPK